MINPPKHLPQDRAVWFGPEVDGLLARTRPYTAILHRHPGAPIADVVAQSPHPVTNLYFTEDFGDLAYIVEAATTWHGTVVIGCHASDHERVRALKASSVSHKVRLFLRYWGPTTFSLLGPEDEISVGEVGHVIAFRVGDGVHTSPACYGDDQ